MNPEANTLPKQPYPDRSEAGLVDPLGRTIDYLRLSVTDRCNLRCLYCMPPEGVGWMPHDEVLRFEEILRLCRIMATLGIKAIKVTGGEPLVRRGVVGLIGELKAVKGINQVSLTSNGVLLGEHLEALVAAGLDAVNISLDTVNEEKFRQLTRTGGLGTVLSAIDRAVELGLKVKVSCVPLRTVNEEDIVRIAALAHNRDITVRFIELMPLGAAFDLQPLPADEVRSLIEKEYGPLKPSAIKLGNGPAVYYTLQGFAGPIGFISALSHFFCQTCNRLRLTAAGLLKPCLSSDLSLDLRSLVRGGSNDGVIADSIRELVARKPARHSFGISDEVSNINMFSIGG
jgi:cyclic pyranopterin phosphate synthase